MFALIQATAPEDFPGVFKMLTEGGAMVLLAFILWVLAKRIPAMADRIAASHEKAIQDCTAGQQKLVEAFQNESREARSLFRTEQETARATHTTLIQGERASCNERTSRLEARVDKLVEIVSTNAKVPAGGNDSPATS